MSASPTPSKPPSDADRTRWFADEVQVHDGQLKAYLRRAFPAVRDVDDVAQESYLRIWKARAAHPILSAKAFLFKVARRVALDFIRKNGHSPVDPLGDLGTSRFLDPKPDAAEALSAREKMELLADAVMALPARCRAIVLLHKIQGVSQREIALRLGISERTVENHCRRGIARCEAYLRQHGIDNLYGDES